MNLYSINSLVWVKKKRTVEYLECETGMGRYTIRMSKKFRLEYYHPFLPTFYNTFLTLDRAILEANLHWEKYLEQFLTLKQGVKKVKLDEINRLEQLKKVSPEKDLFGNSVLQDIQDKIDKIKSNG